MPEKYIRTLIATDSGGAQRKVDYFQTVVVFPSASGRPRRVGQHLLKCDGQMLRRIGRGVYELATSQGPVTLKLKEADPI